MQNTQADPQSCKRVGVEEHLINFRPSPNFKNMKKFIKSTYLCGSSLPDVQGGPVPSTSTSEEKVESKLQNLVAGDWQSPVQPPLPLDPPPSDPPTITVKKEIEDPEYEQASTSAAEKPQDNSETDQKDHSSEICRDFIRGTCKREGTCRYAHRHDVSQLQGVYTFCRKFQNSVCNFTNCKYVHASVFEEQHFYRTGYLPPEKINHHIKANAAFQPPPPPPPEDPVLLTSMMDFSHPPPPRPNEVKPMISMAPPVATTTTLQGGGYMGDMHAPVPPFKREWGPMEPYATAPPPPCAAPYYQPPRKCKNCDSTEFRLQHIKNKLEKTRQCKEEAIKKMARVDKQAEDLRKLISELLRPTISLARNQTNINSASSSVDNDKKLYDLMSSYLTSNRHEDN